VAAVAVAAVAVAVADAGAGAAAVVGDDGASVVRVEHGDADATDVASAVGAAAGDRQRPRRQRRRRDGGSATATGCVGATASRQRPRQPLPPRLPPRYWPWWPAAWWSCRCSCCPAVKRTRSDDDGDGRRAVAMEFCGDGAAREECRRSERTGRGCEDSKCTHGRSAAAEGRTSRCPKCVCSTRGGTRWRWPSAAPRQWRTATVPASYRPPAAFSLARR